MRNYRFEDNFSSLSKKTRKILGSIPAIDAEGFPMEDAMFNVRYIPANQAHAILIDRLREMADEDQLSIALEELSVTHPWASEVLNTIQENNEYFSAFYQDFQKAFIPYVIHKTKSEEDGSDNVTTVKVNEPESIFYLLTD